MFHVRLSEGCDRHSAQARPTRDAQSSKPQAGELVDLFTCSVDSSLVRVCAWCGPLTCKQGSRIFLRFGRCEFVDRARAIRNLVSLQSIRLLGGLSECSMSFEPRDPTFVLEIGAWNCIAVEFLCTPASQSTRTSLRAFVNGKTFHMPKCMTAGLCAPEDERHSSLEDERQSYVMFLRKPEHPCARTSVVISDVSCTRASYGTEENCVQCAVWPCTDLQGSSVAAAGAFGEFSQPTPCRLRLVTEGAPVVKPSPDGGLDLDLDDTGCEKGAHLRIDLESERLHVCVLPAATFRRANCSMSTTPGSMAGDAHWWTERGYPVTEAEPPQSSLENVSSWLNPADAGACDGCRPAASYHDVELEATRSPAGSPPVFAHRVVLGSRVPFFATMFASGMRESAAGLVRVPLPAQRDILLVVLTFVYSGRMLPSSEKDPERLFAVLELAELLCLAHLSALCVERLTSLAIATLPVAFLALPHAACATVAGMSVRKFYTLWLAVRWELVRTDPRFLALPEQLRGEIELAAQSLVGHGVGIPVQSVSLADDRLADDRLDDDHGDSLGNKHARDDHRGESKQQPPTAKKNRANP